MPPILYKLGGIEKWPSVTATVASTEVVSSGGRRGKTMNVRFTFMTGSGEQKGKSFVDDNSSLYGLSEGEQFALQYKPIKLLLRRGFFSFRDYTTNHRSSGCSVCNYRVLD
jgi:hypothetical protein